MSQAIPHPECAAYLFDAANAETNPMHGIPGAMAVTDGTPIITAPEFPPSGLTCPHGTHFYVYPNAERIAALRAMNEEAER